MLKWISLSRWERDKCIWMHGFHCRGQQTAACRPSLAHHLFYMICKLRMACTVLKSWKKSLKDFLIHKIQISGSITLLLYQNTTMFTYILPMAALALLKLRSSNKDHESPEPRVLTDLPSTDKSADPCLAMWDFPCRIRNWTWAPAMKCRVLTSGLPGKSLETCSLYFKRANSHSYKWFQRF